MAREVEIQNTNTDTGLNINGRCPVFTGTIAAFQFNVGGRLVKGDANDRLLRQHAVQRDLVNGRAVQVKGAQRDGFVYATRITRSGK